MFIFRCAGVHAPGEKYKSRTLVREKERTTELEKFKFRNQKPVTRNQKRPQTAW